MNTLLDDAHAARDAGHFDLSIRLYRVAADAKRQSATDRAIAHYMLVYLFATSRAHVMGALGCDLRSPQQDNYAQAGELLRLISSTDFDPVAHGLPALAGYDLFEIAESNPIVAEEILLNPYLSQSLSGRQLCHLGQSNLALAVAMLNTPHLSERLSEMDLFCLAKEQPFAFEQARAGDAQGEDEDDRLSGTSFSTQAI